MLVVGNAIAGCEIGTNIVPAGPDTYMLIQRFAPNQDESDAAQVEALTKSREYCEQQGRVFVPNNTAQSSATSTSRPTFTFRCLLPDDPAVASYRLQQAAKSTTHQGNH